MCPEKIRCTLAEIPKPLQHHRDQCQKRQQNLEVEMRCLDEIYDCFHGEYFKPFEGICQP